MTGVVGRAISLSCPDLSNDTVISGDMLAIKEWFRGSNSNPNAKVAKLMTKGDNVKHKNTVNERIGISSMEGNLVIKNLTMGDVGFYTCHFTGSGPHSIELNVITG